MTTTRDRPVAPPPAGRDRDPALAFRVLGPLEVSGPDGPIPLGGPKQRTVLAHLVMRANALVEAEALRDALWGDEPPESAVNVVQSYVSHLRRAIGRDRIAGQATGYRLRIGDDELDADHFERLLRSGRLTLAETPELAASTFEEALRLWRGPALADVRDDHALISEAARLEGLRLEAEESRMEAYLATGQAARAAGELESLVAAEPLRESLWVLLIRALYAQGRQADALDAYRRIRRILRDELGIDPSRELARLQRQVLEQDPALESQGLPLRGYRLMERVRDARAGSVFRALQPSVGRDVEVTIIGGARAGDAAFVRRFEHSARAVASLEHPHITPIHDFWREPGRAYIVARHLKGGSLAALERDGTFSDPVRAARVVDEVASAVAYAHRQGVTHGDLSAASVHFDGDGNAYLVDFAIADAAGAPDADLRSLASLARHLMPHDAGVEAIAERALIDASNVDADAFAAAARLASGHPGRTGRTIDERNPYKGLRAFEETDARDFHGRATLTARILARLTEPSPSQRFVAIVGPSGAGKSSLARAGVLAAIRSGALVDPGTLYITDMVPGADPFDELEGALARIAIGPQPGLRDLVDSGPRGVLEAIDRALPADGWLVLLVDQLEELFTLTTEDGMRDRFLEGLRVAAADPDARVHVIVTLRADFYDEPLRSPRFGTMLADRTEAVPPLSADEVEAAIRRPADGVGIEIEPGLVAALLTDLASEPGTLPLLEFTLTELVERRDGGALTLEAYRALGGVTGALANRADRTFASLGVAAQSLTRQVFLRLVSLGEGRQDTRRRVARSELLDLSSDPGVIDNVLEAFGRHRILTFDREPASREPTAELAHESLLTAWPRLRDWVDAARDDLRRLAQLSRSATDWRAAGEDASFLLRGSRLERMAEWSTVTDLVLGRPERAFLGASLERRDAEHAAERTRIEHEERLERGSRTRLRALAAVLAVAVLVTTSLAVVAASFAQRAGHEADISVARELAFAAIANLAIDPERAVLLAMSSADRTRAADGTVLPEAEDALHRAIAASRVVDTLPEAGGAVAWSATGTVAHATPVPGVVEVRRGSDLAELSHFAATDAPITGLTFSPDGSTLAVTDVGGRLSLLDPATGTVELLHEGPGGVAGASFSGDGTRIAASWYEEGVARVFVAADGVLETALRVNPSPTTALSPDGRSLALAIDSPTSRVRVIDLVGDASPIDLDASFLGGLAWSPDGRSLAAMAFGGADVWTTATWEHAARLVMPTPGDRIVWGPDSQALAAGGSDTPVVSMWRLDGSEVAERIDLVADETSRGIGGLAFSPDGDHLIAGATDGNAAKVWDVSPTGDAEVLGLATTGAYDDVAFLPDDRLVAVGDDRRLHVIDLASGAVGPPFGPPSTGRPFEVSPDGSAVAVPLGDESRARTSPPLERGGVAAWEIATGRELFHVLDIGQEVDDVAWTSDGRFLAALGRQDGHRVTVVDRGGAIVSSLPVDAEGFRFGPADDSLAVVERTASGALVRIWDWRRAEVTRTIETDRIGTVAFDPGGGRFLAGFGPPGIYDLEGGARVGSLEGYPAVAAEVTYDASGSTIAAVVDRAVGIYDGETGQRRFLLPTSGDRLIGRVAISMDGSLVAAHAFGMLSVWTLDLDRLLAIAQENVTRAMTDDECRRYLHAETCPADPLEGTTLTS